jgi:hypothetical protein
MFSNLQHFWGKRGMLELQNGDKDEWQVCQLFILICSNQTISWLLHSWNIFDARMNHEHTWMNHGHTQNHKTQHGVDLGEGTTFHVVTLALGSRPRQGFARLWAKRNPRSEGKCEGMNLHIPKGASILGVGILVNSQILRDPLDWKFLYIIGNLLKYKCLKWAHMIHLDICNTSYGQTKGRESNWQFDSEPLKVKNWPDFLVCKWRVT